MGVCGILCAARADGGQQEQEAAIEVGFRGPENRPCWSKLSPTPIVGADRLPCVLALIEDVTGQREAESLARDRQEKMLYSARMAALGEMAGGIAHEINNPLAVIDATARVLHDRVARGDPDPAFLAESLASVQKMIRRISTIISGLRRFSRDGSQDPLQTLSLPVILQDTLGFCREALDTLDVKVRVNVPEDLFVRGRSVELSQVALNVLNNALDALRDAPVKRLELRAPPRRRLRAPRDRQYRPPPCRPSSRTRSSSPSSRPSPWATAWASGSASLWA